jgi:hypothetical protein
MYPVEADREFLDMIAMADSSVDISLVRALEAQTQCLRVLDRAGVADFGDRRGPGGAVLVPSVSSRLEDGGMAIDSQLWTTTGVANHLASAAQLNPFAAFRRW